MSYTNETDDFMSIDAGLSGDSESWGDIFKGIAKDTGKAYVASQISNSPKPGVTIAQPTKQAVTLPGGSSLSSKTVGLITVGALVLIGIYFFAKRR